MRRINSVWATVAVVGLSPPAWAGPYSTGLSNTNSGAVDPGIPGFVTGSVNPAFVGWASSVTSYAPAPGVDSGWDNPAAALGAVTGDNFDIVSLGDLDASQIAANTPPGKITLAFQGGIRNSGGPDFAVFENSLGTANSVFGELAYVEVSSDGQHFARFPSVSLTPAAVGPYGSIDPTNVHNLPGKHVNAYGESWGTPMDLSDLSSDPVVQSGQVNLNGIRFVRLVDIPGNGCFTDSSGRPIYDAWLTFGSGGFDLEAIGVLHNWRGGDANLDGIINAADLGILAKHWQQSAADFTDGDFDGSGFVDVRDLSILAANWQGSAAALAAATSFVPEPAFAPFVGVLGLFSIISRSNLRRRKMLRSLVFVVLALVSTTLDAGTSTFEDLGLPANSFHNNGSFASGGAQYNNSFTDFGGGFTAWDGFAYSNKTDTTTAGFGNQYSAIPGSGAGSSSTYGVGFVGGMTPTITLPPGASPLSIDITNTTYAYISMHDGDAFAKKFGGVSGNDPDFFLLTITGKNAANAIVGSVDFYLADFRFADNSQDFIRNTWSTVDLGSLAGSRSLTFDMTSTDVGQFGINTPTYFALDNVTFTPEPACGLLLALGCFIRRR